MIEAEMEYIRLTGILRNRIYYHWQRRVMVRAQLIDIGRADPVEASTNPLVEESHPYATSKPSRMDEIIDYLAQHGPSRPSVIARDLQMPASTVVTICARFPNYFQKSQPEDTRAYRSNRVMFYALRRD